MAVLIPSVFGRRLTSDAERKLAERFERELPADTVLMHSVGLVRHRSKRWAEVDFVLVCAGGVFCIEVKGGRVSRTDGVWNFTDRHGRVDTKYEGPFDQAGAAAGALQGWLDAAGIRRDDGTRYQVGYAVMTPDCVLDVVGPDIEHEVLFDKQHVSESLDTFVRTISSYWQDRQRYKPLGHEEIGRLRNAVRPDFEAMMTRSLAIGHVEDQLIRSTDEQAQVLDGLVDNERLVVIGAAGTGKSMLAVGEAKRLVAEGRRVLLVCHSPVLAAALANAAGTGVDVSTVRRFMSDIIDRAGLRRRVPDATDDALFDIFLPELAAEGLDAHPELAGYDALVIDEGQDILRGDAIRVLDAALSGHLAAGCWRVFQDPNQNIFGRVRKESLDLLEGGTPARYRLTENCRNTQQISECATLLSGATVQADSQISGPEVDVCERWDDRWQQRTLAQVRAVIADGLPCDDIVVLVPIDAQRRSVVSADPDLLSVTRSANRVLVSTIADFKGLEATAVVLAGLESLDDPQSRQAAYVGSTRAKVLLRIVLPGRAQASLARRISEYAVEAASRARDAAGR